jgi:hypothetical protein
MKKIIIFAILSFCAYSCIKKDALKYDPQLVGTWVSYQDSVNTWLIITSDGHGHYATNGDNESSADGAVKYSLFENKMWVGNKKFRIKEWLTGKTGSVSAVRTKEYSTLKDTTYRVDMQMILKTPSLLNSRTVTLYRVHQ